MTVRVTHGTRGGLFEHDRRSGSLASRSGRANATTVQGLRCSRRDDAGTTGRGRGGSYDLGNSNSRTVLAGL